MLNLFIVTRILRAGRYLEVSGPPEHADRLATATHWFNQTIEWTFLIAGAIVAFDLCYELWQVVKARRQGAM